MILTFSVEVLLELNIVLLIVPSLKVPSALVLFSLRLGYALFLFIILESILGIVFLLLVVLSQVDTIPTSIVVDPLLLLDVHHYELHRP
jgi:hypothetical protein